MMSGKVVCLVRGGEAGRIIQEKAIDYAGENNQKLVFLHVIDLQSMPLENEAILEAARRELSWLASFNLNLARKRAELAGIRTETIIRFGPVIGTVEGYVKEIQASSLFVGSPSRQIEGYEERLALVRKFTERISRDTNIPVVLDQEEGSEISPPVLPP